MNKAVFYIMGGFVLWFAVASLGVGLIGLLSATGDIPRLSSQDFLRVTAIVFFLSILSLGLFKLRKWAALLCSLLTLYMAFLTFRSAVWPGKSGPGDANWVGFLWAAVLILPLVLTAIYWRSLVWTGSQVEPPRI